MPAHFEYDEKVTVAKFELAFTRCRNNLKMIGNLTVRNSLQDFDVKEMFLLPKNRSFSFQVSKNVVYVILECSHSAAVKMCWLEFRFQNLPFSKSAGKNVPFSCER